MADHQPLTFRYLSQEQVIDLGGLDMAKAINDVEEVLRLHAAGDSVLPSKTVMRWGDVDSETTRGRINAMPGFIGGRFQAAGIKWIASFPSNIDRGLPRGSAVTILNDPHTGVPLAVMDGTLISAMRTGAVSGVATRLLARAKIETVGILGAGVQSRTQLLAVRVARPHLSRVVVYDPRRDRAEAWCADMAARVPASYELVDSPREAAEAADILVSATTSSEPIVEQGWVRPGVLYLQVGGLECRVEALADFDRIVVDNWAEMKHRAAQTLVDAHARGVIGDSDISAELAEIVLGRQPGRSTPDERIYFSSVGMGIEDIAIASRIWRSAVERGIGAELDLWQQPAFV